MTDPDRRDADSGHVEWHTADRDLSHGFGKRDGDCIGKRGREESRTKWKRGREDGGASLSVHSMTKPILRLPFTFTAPFTTDGEIAKTP